ncbi:hypothetical protein BDR22DRAFT_155100 [Usnea florida]
MLSYAAPIALSTILFITMLQPCPAPVVATIGILDAAYGAGLFGGGVVAGTWAASHGAAAVKPPAPAPAVPASSDPVTEYRRQDLTPFEQCTSDGLTTAQTAEFPANGSIIVADLPPSCITWFEHYNLHPQIEELNRAHGTIVVINGSAVEFAHLPPYVVTYVDSTLFNKTAVSRARRALVAASA